MISDDLCSTTEPSERTNTGCRDFLTPGCDPVYSTGTSRCAFIHMMYVGFKALLCHGSAHYLQALLAGEDVYVLSWCALLFPIREYEIKQEVITDRDMSFYLYYCA